MGADAIRFVFRRPFQAREFLEQSWFIARVALASDVLGRHPVHGSDQLHSQHPAARIGCCGSQRCGCGVRRSHPGRPAGDGVDRGRRRCDGDVRGPRLAHDPRRDRRNGGAGHQPRPAAGDAPDARGRSGRAAAQQPGRHHRDRRRLRVLGVRAGRQPGRVRRGDHAADRRPRGDHLLRQGSAVRPHRRLGGVLPRTDSLGGGAKAVGNAVNETVVYAFMALFVVNVVVTAIGIRFTTK